MAARTIDLGSFPENPTQDDVDRAMRGVSEKLGGTWTAERHGDAWRVSRDESPVGGRPRRRFDVALGEATGYAIVASTPVRSDEIVLPLSSPARGEVRGGCFVPVECARCGSERRSWGPSSLPSLGGDAQALACDDCAQVLVILVQDEALALFQRFAEKRG